MSTRPLTKYQELYDKVLMTGKLTSPRDRKVLEIGPILYENKPGELIDQTKTRNVNPSYIAREFLWFCHADPRDLRIAKYAKLWLKCMDSSGKVESNYGEYLFHKDDQVFWKALDQLVNDPNSRRCWIPIFHGWHQYEQNPNDLPCTTGIGFQIYSDYQLDMTVHMRSQDLWYGAANDIPICGLFLEMAKAYLAWMGIVTDTGVCYHFINNLHLYERHWSKAIEATIDESVVPELSQLEDLIQTGFNTYDILVLRKQARYNSIHCSDLLNHLMVLAGEDYGCDDPIWKGN